MEEDRFAGGAVPPDEPQSIADAISDYTRVLTNLARPGTLGTRDELEAELDSMAGAIRVFWAKPADQVMRECSGYTARLTEMAMLLHRAERISAGDRNYARIRTQQVEKFLAELDRQWKTASRLIEVQRQDLAVMNGLV